MARGRLALGLGLAVYVAAWAFGSRPLYPVAVGLLLLVAVTWASVQLAARPMRIQRVAGRGDHVEGDDVPVEFVVEPEGWTGLASIVMVERVARVGEQRTELRRHGAQLRGRYWLRALSRGRYALEEAYAVIEDPFGLQRASTPLPTGGAVLVYPQLVDIERLFSESGGRTQEGRRLLLRRPSGFDLHSVREYEQGESLRKVHWRSTAHRGQLMVKELEDAPRDEVAVLLDADAAVVVGSPPDSSFELQVRAAGSILQAHALRGRRAALVINSLVPESQRVHSYAGDWRRALELLAAVEPSGRTPVTAVLAEEEGLAARSLELAVVTARLTPELVDRFVQRALAHRGVSLVYVDASSFAPRAPELSREPGLLRLQAAGVPVAVLRRGDDVAAKLSADAAAQVQHG